MTSSSHPSRTLLGFDYGTRRIGVAVGQEITHTAQGLTTLDAVHGSPDWRELDALIHDWRPQMLVVGMPHSMDDRPHPLRDAVEDFGNQLKQRYNLPVEWIDEKLSSLEAEQALAGSRNSKSRKQNKSEIDKLAAQVILQTWLNNKIT